MTAWQSGTRGAEPELVICGPTVMLPKGADVRHAIGTVRLTVHPPEIPCLIDGSAAMGLLPGWAGPPGGRLSDD